MRRIAVHCKPTGNGASEQSDEAYLARDAIVAVELGVGGPLLLDEGDLRAEAAHGDAAVVHIDADRTGEVAAGAAAEHERRPGVLVVGPAQRSRAAEGEAPGKEERGPQAPVPNRDVSPRGLAVTIDDDFLMAVQHTLPVEARVYRHDGSSWDSGIALPSGEINPQGLAVMYED